MENRFKLLDCIEKLFGSELTLSLVEENSPDSIVVGESEDIFSYCGRDDEPDKRSGYVIGPKHLEEKLNFSFHRQPEALDFLKIKWIESGPKYGTVMCELSDNTIYWLHQSRETLPDNINYERVKQIDYIYRLNELTEGWMEKNAT